MDVAKIRGWLVGLGLTLAVGAAAGWGLDKACWSNVSVSGATLFFPPASTPDKAAERAFSSPRDWARSQLFSPENLVSLCKILESQGATPAVLASACTLQSEGRLEVFEGEPSLLHLRVRAGTPQLAQQLCAGTLVCLNHSLLEFNATAAHGKRASLYQEAAPVLRRGEAAEKELVRVAQWEWLRPPQKESDTSFSFLGGGSGESVESERGRSDFQAGLRASRRCQAQNAHLELEQETSMPGFVLVDPPAPRAASDRGQAAGVGAMAGLAVFGLAGLFQALATKQKETSHAAL